MLFADPGRELLRQVDATLLVFGGQVLHVESGSVAEIQAAAGEVDAGSIAACVRKLIGVGDDRSILLLLPPGEFAATETEMPGVSGENLRSALDLQRENLLPAMEESLELAVHGSEDGAQVALWIKSWRIRELHEAFAANGLFLAAVKPRNLHSEAPRAGLVDADGSGLTFAQSSAGVLRQWKHVDAADLEQEEFAGQWDAEVRAVSAGKSRRIDSIAKYAGALERGAHADYSFFPAAAAALCRRREQRRHLLRASCALGVVALLAASPFIFQQFEISDLNRQLELRRDLSASARAHRDVVVDFENRWGAIENFPDQDVREAMFTLQQVLSPNRLSDLEISEGVVRIQGTSEDPQSILQQLEQNPMFTEAVFSRATSNDQYYIDLRLADVNFEAYMARYFPDR
ncbi:MAG: PilN domain-containing protein [Rhodospirillaceae bacterium]|nr:PilN domain-containing protein [Rhodospirillaceae bacterium]